MNNGPKLFFQAHGYRSFTWQGSWLAAMSSGAPVAYHQNLVIYDLLGTIDRLGLSGILIDPRQRGVASARRLRRASKIPAAALRARESHTSARLLHNWHGPGRGAVTTHPPIPSLLVPEISTIRRTGTLDWVTGPLTECTHTVHYCDHSCPRPVLVAGGLTNPQCQLLGRVRKLYGVGKCPLGERHRQSSSNPAFFTEADFSALTDWCWSRAVKV
jgi:hypothetical protein